ncbi:MAG: PDZ domain-containing protein [Pseudomonadota bacterium]
MKKMNTIVLLLGIFTILVLLAGGCATTMPVGPTGRYTVNVNSITNADIDLKDKTYILLSSLRNVNENDLQFKEFARYIANALSKTGYKRVDSIKNANIIIGMAYGIGNPKTETSTQIYTTSTGYSYPIGWTWIHVPPQTEKVTTKTTTYMRYLILEAFDSKDKQSQVWKTTVKSEGTGNDLRVALPHMIAASIFEFGTNTESNRQKIMYENAARVLDIMDYSRTAHETPFTGKERLGVYLKQLNPEDQLLYHNKKAGVLVIDVAQNSVAQKMGIKQYDIILAVNNRIINNQQILLDMIQKIKPGGKIRIAFFSWDKIQEVSATGYFE